MADPLNPVRVARQAMATRFEIVLHGGNPVSLRAAGEEALAEIERIESHISLYQNTSDIARANALAAGAPVRVSAEVFGLLQQSQALSAETGGVFDITIAPLVKCWGFMNDTGHWPGADTVAAARASVGMHLLELDPRDCTVRFSRPGVMIDLGAIGKGFAVERAASILRDAGVNSAIIHGGTSTVYALGRPPGPNPWKVAIAGAPHETDSDQKPIAVVSLEDEALSVSAVWGRSFQHESKAYGHVIDPRTGQPTTAAALAAVITPSATESDAFSTALLTLGEQGLDRISSLRAGARCLVLTAANGEIKERGLRLPAN